jgi:uncharacterized protein (TIGR03032 family)
MSDRPTTTAESDGQGSAEPLRSVHTSNFPELLQQLGVSLLVTTYQAGRLVILRAAGDVLNTHFRNFDKPMGLAVTANRIAVGAATSIWEFHNLPAVCEKLDSPSGQGEAVRSVRHDACYLPRVTHWTGDIQVHEMAWVGDDRTCELWFVNTRFSCLCRRSEIYNFDPVWRPEFVRELVPTDCCHLNGLGLRDGRPSCLTALGQTGEPAGWRERKRDGGVVIDYESRELICTGLSMPHSPRWYRDRWWLLESGTGSFGYLDSQTGRYQSVCHLPGFTRGLSFAGPLAFVGLSQVRESAVFGGIPIAERALEERICGVWAIHLDSGSPVAFLRFEDAVQEIFAVEVTGAHYPELVNEPGELLSGSFELPDQALTEVPEQFRASRRLH